MRNLQNDIRYAIQNLLKRPGPLPFPELDRVVTLWDKIPGRGVTHNEVI